MENTLYNISQVLGLTLIHSLWQGLLIWFVLRTVFISVPSLSPVKKYNLAVASMLCIFVCFIYTLCTEVHDYNWINLKSLNALPALPYLGLSVNPRYFLSSQSIYNTISGYLPYISAVYIAGLAINFLKLGWEWNKIRLIKQSVIPAGQMQQFINTFSKKLDLTKLIQIKFSNSIDVPCVMGCLKPIIFLPVSIATYLSACEIEAILLHELSHIKRNDYLVNLLQQFINVILFFNPFAQLVNRIINRERENGCDDLVVEKTNKPLIYARALLKLEESRVSNLTLALAATGKKHYLLNRIERIMKTKKTIGSTRHLLTAILLLAGSLGSIAWFNPNVGNNTATPNTAKPSHSINGVPALNTPGVFANALLSLKNYGARLTSDTDTAKTKRYILVGDSLKHSKKAKVIVIDKNGNKKEYNSVDELPKSEQNDLFEQNFNMSLPEMDSIKKFYSSPEWKSQMEAMKKQGEEMKKQFNSPEWKKQMLAMQKQGEEMKKQFNSPEWKKQMEDMQKQFNGPEWKKQMEDMKLQGEEMKKQFNSPEWKKQMEDMQRQFNSPQWKKQMEEMQRQFNSPEWKKQMEEMKLNGEEMQKQFNSPEWKKQMEEMKNWNWNDDNDSIGKPEKPVKKAVHTKTAKKKVKAN